MADCIEKLRELAQTETGDPRDAAGRIVREVKASTSGVEFEGIKRRLEDTLVAGRHTSPPTPQFELHTRWLAALQGAITATKNGDRLSD